MKKYIGLFGLLMVLSACSSLEKWSNPSTTLRTGGQMDKWSLTKTALSSSSASSEQMDLAVEIEEDSSSSAMTGTGALMEQLTQDGFLLIGDPDAKKTLTVFTNASCAYCREFQTEMFPRLSDEFILTGKLNVQIAIVPLKKYPDSTVQAAALLCATAQGKGLPMLQALATATSRDRKSVLALLKTVGLPQKAFMTCLNSKETKNILATQRGLIDQNGVTLIPAFELGAERKVGLMTYADLRGWIKERFSR